ncbi:MAG: glycosyltransferase family 1 protein [Acidobacteriota bacterium]|nr:glycosyltransferase family 1 protein [Acidobacteriota bacterium]
MSRFARTGRVFFFEEPVFETCSPYLRSSVCPKTGVHVLTPVLPDGLSPAEVTRYQQSFITSAIAENQVRNYVAWYYTPMAKEFTEKLRPAATVYDCMDELSCFAGAPPAMRGNELTLFDEADLVFTGGRTLYESKKKQHGSVHLFPSSVDVPHFARARMLVEEPPDQAALPHPKLGYAGVIDERIDLELIRRVAELRPGRQLVFLGPVVKIDPACLPRAANIHYLGMKQYADLPAYFSGWRVGLLPFALNEATRFISPTKTPEYLAAGLQVISTSIRDVVSPYGDQCLARIVNNAQEFVEAGDAMLANAPDRDFRARVDNFLSQSSWESTWSEMNHLIRRVLDNSVAGKMPLNKNALGSAVHAV